MDNEKKYEIYELIEKQKKRINYKDECIEDLINEKQLLLHQTFDILKKNIEYYSFMTAFPDDLVNGFIMLKTGKTIDGEKLDKRRKYMQITRYEVCKEHIEDLVEAKIEISKVEKERIDKNEVVNPAINIAIYFSTYGLEWKLMIPVVDSINFSTYARKREDIFMLSLYVKKDTYQFIGHTFDENKISEIMLKGSK